MKFILMFSLLVGCAQAQKPTLNDVFDFYGTKKVSSLESFTFTFNVKKTDKSVHRNWKWYPNSNLVEYRSEDGNIESFTLHRPKNDKEKVLDKKFINDSYWLLFPFQLSKDHQKYTLKFQANQRSPIHGLEVGKYTIFYEDVGYTPGDIYELFVNEKHEVLAWVYLKAGAQKATRVTTWDDTESFEGVKISTAHRKQA